MPTAYDTWLEGDCGIDAAEEAREEAREEYIADNAPALAKKLIGSEDFCEGVFRHDLSDDDKDWVLTHAARFVEVMERVQDDDAHIAAVAVRYWREMRGFALAAAMDQAKQEAAADFERQEAAMPRTQAEYRAELSL